MRPLRQHGTLLAGRGKEAGSGELKGLGGVAEIGQEGRDCGWHGGTAAGSGMHRTNRGVVGSQWAERDSGP